MQLRFRKSKSSRLFIGGILFTAILIGTPTFTVLSSFYPIDAAALGISSSLVGLIFSGFEIGVLTLGPIVGALGNLTGLRFKLVWSLFFCASSTFLFAFVDWTTDNASHVALSIAIRVFQGAGFFGIQSAALAIMASLFPNNLSKAISIIEIASGLGFSIGPPIGGILYEIGGFMLPFVFNSTICFILFIILFVCTVESSHDSDSIDNGHKSSFFTLIKMYEFYVTLLELAIFTATYVFFDVSLSTFLQSHFGLTPFKIGLVFALDCALYAIGGPIVGHLSDKFKKPALCMALGAIINALAYTFLGPLPLFHWESHLWMSVISTSLVGVGSALMYIPSMQYLLQAAIAQGVPDDRSLKNNLSNVVTFGGGIGGLLGPIGGGMLLEIMEFEMVCYFIVGLNLLMAAILFTCMAVDSLQKKHIKNSLPERTALLSNS